MAHYSAVSPIVVGRKDEIAVLSDALDDVRRTGSSRLVLVSGPAGMGKSRMVAEANRLAAAVGLTRLEGHCTAEASVPYAPLVTAIRRRTRTMDSDEIASLFAGPASLAAALLPEIADVVGPTPTPRASDDLLAAAWRMLARLAKPNGAILVLEDLHWADDGTLRLLDYLAREQDGLPVLVVGTYRSDEMHRRHPLSMLLTDLTRERRLLQVDLKPLDAQQIAEMLSAIFDGTQVSPEFADLLADRTDGNPFFLEELLKVMVERGDVYRTASDWERRELVDIEMPSTVRETLLARARSMKAQSVEILQLAALDRVELDAAVLQRAAGADADTVDEAISEGLELQILVERRDGGHPTYAFRHALSREAFGDELVGPERRRAHRRIAEAVEQVHGQALDAVAARLADHFTAAGEDAVALEHALRAARYAAASGAEDEADRRYDQALRLLPARDPRQQSILTEAIGLVATTMSPMKAAFAEDLRRVAHDSGDRVAESYALTVTAAHLWDEGRGPESIELTGQAIDLVRGLDDSAQAWAISRHTRMRALADQVEPGDALLEEGIELAERSGHLLALSHLHGTRMLVQPDDVQFSHSYEQSLAAARAAGNEEFEATVHVNAGYVWLWTGRFARSEDAFVRGVALYDRLAPALGYPRVGLAWLRALQGRFEEATLLAQPWRAARRLPDRFVALTALAEIELRRRAPEAQESVAELWRTASRMGEAQRSVQAGAARARHVLATDGVDAAQALFWETLEGTVTSNMRGSHWPFSPDLAAALAAEGRVSALAEWAAAIERVTAIDANPHNLAAQSLVRGYLLSVSGGTRDAAAAFSEAVDRYDAMPAPARIAEALVGLAQVSARDGDTRAAEEALDRAATLADTLASDQLGALVTAVRAASTARPVLATLLFTDIVDSTSRAVALGDLGWRDLLERHHGIVRRELARHGGRELDTAGDGFLAAFDSPAAGVRCAVAARRALDEAGIAIRAGLHTGEAHESGGKLTGLTVHIAARVGGAAQAGEVLVSGTVRELMAGSGVGFADRGTRELKGVPGEWHLYAVES